MVVEKFNGPNVTLDYYGGTSGTYAGFDDFARVKQQWEGTKGSERFFGR